MDVTLYAYLAYVLISVALTVWVGRTLHKNGRAFLVDVFAERADLADSDDGPGVSRGPGQGQGGQGRGGSSGGGGRQGASAGGGGTGGGSRRRRRRGGGGRGPRGGAPQG